MDKNDGRGAYPIPEARCKETKPTPDMTLRDWFAGQALPAVMSVYKELAMEGRLPDVDLCAEAAETAYQFADAMLDERDREK